MHRGRWRDRVLLLRKRCPFDGIASSGVERLARDAAFLMKLVPSPGCTNLDLVGFVECASAKLLNVEVLWMVAPSLLCFLSGKARNRHLAPIGISAAGQRNKARV